MSGNSKDTQDTERFHEGKANSHDLLDSKDSRSIANRLAGAEHDEQKPDPRSKETRRVHEDATLPARAHGNEPSRGAKIDQQLREEEEDELRNKRKA